MSLQIKNLSQCNVETRLCVCVCVSVCTHEHVSVLTKKYESSLNYILKLLHCVLLLFFLELPLPWVHACRRSLSISLFLFLSIYLSIYLSI